MSVELENGIEQVLQLSDLQSLDLGSSSTQTEPIPASLALESSIPEPDRVTPALLTSHPLFRRFERERMFFDRRKPATIFVIDNIPKLSDDEIEDDERSLEEAERAEQVLGSALHFAQMQTGESIMASVQGASRNDVIEFGRRISSLSDIRGGRSASLLNITASIEDNISVKSWDSNVTETTFIKISKGDPSILMQKSWEDIAGNTDGRECSSSRPHKSQIPSSVLCDSETTLNSKRNWDKLRDTLKAEENGASVCSEVKSDVRKKKKSRSRSLRSLRDGLRKSFGGLVRSMKAKTGAAKSRDAATPAFNVNIRVEDLSFRVEDKPGESSFDTTLASIEDDDHSLWDLPLNFKVQEEAESLEVVCCGPCSTAGLSEILPPFSSRLVKC